MVDRAFANRRRLILRCDDSHELAHQRVGLIERRQFDLLGQLGLRSRESAGGVVSRSRRRRLWWRRAPHVEKRALSHFFAVKILSVS